MLRRQVGQLLDPENKGLGNIAADLNSPFTDLTYTHLDHNDPLHRLVAGGYWATPNLSDSAEPLPRSIFSAMEAVGGAVLEYVPNDNRKDVILGLGSELQAARASYQNDPGRALSAWRRSFAGEKLVNYQDKLSAALDSILGS
jgi:hypothetical protein